MSVLATSAITVETSLRTPAVAGVVETLFRNNEVIGEFQPLPFSGGGTINIKMHYAGNTSVGRYSEGDADGTAGTQSYLTAYWPETHYRGQIGFTGHARDYTPNPGDMYFDQLGQELERLYADVTDYISQDMLGTGLTSPVGIQGIVDSAGTIALLNRSTYTWWQAYETTAASTTIATTDLDFAMYQSSDATYAGKTDQIWTSWKQAAKWKGVQGNPGTTASPVIVMSDGGKGPVTVNPGTPRDQQYYGDMPIKKKRNLTDSVWLALTTEDFFIGVMRGFTVKALPFQSDTDRFQLTCAYSIGCKNPKRSFKITNATA